MTRRKLSYRPVFLSVLTFCLITLQPDLYGSGTSGFSDALFSVLARYGDFSLPVFLLLPCLYLLYRYVAGRVAPGDLLRPSVLAPAILFGIGMPLGYAFEETGDLAPVFASGAVPFLQFLLNGIGWFILADHGIALLYHGLENAGQRAGQQEEGPFTGLFGWYRRLVSRSPFWTIFLTLVILYIPHAVISFPGIFMGDTWQQVVQAYSELGSTGSPYLSVENVIRAGVYINQNHPAVPTLLLHGLLVIGNAVTGSFNTGAALYCGLQALCLAAATACTASLLIRRGLFPLRYAWVIPLYGFLNPILHTSAVLLTKDVFYSAFWLFLLTGLFRVLTGEKTKGAWTCAGLGSLGILLFRNEGRFLLIVSFLAAALIGRETRKAFFIACGGAVLTSLLVFRLIFPALGFTPGSVREPFSIPFQQTARTVRDCPEDITEEEQAAIGRVLDYESLADLYDPDLADPVKNTFREDASTEDLLAYFRTWAGMGFRHPDVYLQAFLNKNYQYFYPGKTRLYLYDYAWSDVNYDFTNWWIAPLERAFSQIEGLAPARAAHDRAMTLAETLPVLDVLCTPALYTWMVILAFCFALRRKDRRMIAWTVFPLALLVMNLFTPANANYGRYMLPVIAAAPFLPAFIRGYLRHHS